VTVTEDNRTHDDGPPMPDAVTHAMNAFNESLKRRMAGFSKDGFSFVPHRDMGNMMPLVMRCATVLASEARDLFGEGEWQSIEERIACFSCNWTEAWKRHVDDELDWRTLFSDIVLDGTRGPWESRVAWALLADAAMRLLVLAPVHMDHLGAQAIKDVDRDACARAFASVALADHDRDERRDLFVALTDDRVLSCDDGMRLVSAVPDRPIVRLQGARVRVASWLRRMADRLAGTEVLAERLAERRLAEAIAGAAHGQADLADEAVQ